MTAPTEKSFYQINDKGLLLNILVRPNASVTKIEGLYDGQLKIRLNAQPIEGAANQACIKYLSKLLGVPKTSMEIVSGAQSRQKRLQLHVSAEKAQAAALLLNDLLNS